MPPPVWGRGGCAALTGANLHLVAPGSGVHNWEVQERQETKITLHSGRRSGASKGLLFSPLAMGCYQDPSCGNQSLSPRILNIKCSNIKTEKKVNIHSFERHVTMEILRAAFSFPNVLLQPCSRFSIQLYLSNAIFFY